MNPGLEATPIPPAVPPVIEPPGRSALQPVPTAERIRTLDVLRGFALFGILVVNVELFGWPIYKMFTSSRAPAAPADLIGDWMVRFLFQGKFYLLFSFLFGLGVVIQWQRAQAHGRRFGPFFCRRLLVLLAIGLAHAFLLWEGDILVCYALCGFLLLAFCNCQPKTLLVWAVVFSMIPLLMYTGIWLLVTLASLVPEGAKAVREEFARQDAAFARLTEQNLHIFREGNLRDIFAARARNALFAWQCLFFYAPTVIGMFLVGLYAGRRGVLHHPAANLRFIRRTLFWGFALGLPIGVAYSFAAGSGNFMKIDLMLLASMTALAISGPALCLAYAATLTLLLQRDSWKARLRPIAAAGQMALSNYLLQSVVCTFIFYSYGLAWYGSVGRASALVLAVVVYAGQLLLSVWWLKRFRFGPAEWLWRSLTYGQRQPIRV